MIWVHLRQNVSHHLMDNNPRGSDEHMESILVWWHFHLAAQPNTFFNSPANFVFPRQSPPAKHLQKQTTVVEITIPSH